MRQLAVLTFIIITMVGVSIGMQAQMFPLLVKNEMGATYQDLGNLGTVKFLPVVIIPIFVGILLDRINNAYLLALGILLRAVPLLMISISNSVAEMLLWQLMIGFSDSFLWPPSQAIITTDAKSRKKYVARLMMFFVAGMMVGPLLGALILEVSDDNLRLPFQVAGAMMAASMILIYRMRHVHPQRKHSRLDLRSFVKILHFPAHLALVILSAASFGLLYTIHPAFLSDQGVDTTPILILFAIYSAARMLSMLAAPYLHDHAPATLTSCAVMITAAMAIFIFETSYAYFIAATVLLGIGISIIYPMCLEAILSRTYKHTHNKIIGAYSSVMGAGWLSGPLLGGYVAGAFGPVGPYWLFLVLGAAVSLASLSLHRRQNADQLSEREWDYLPD